MSRPVMSPSAPVVWSADWAYEKAAQALKYLAENYPECGGSDRLDSCHHESQQRRYQRLLIEENGEA
jgi:hypothetical protein